ncbi:MAG: signal peptidase I [Lachnospiraceae bacterium]|nr:signal peptidase I [Lachnospiraceae bacterium]
MARRHKGLNFYYRRKKISPTIVREGFSIFVGICLWVFLAFVLVYFFGIKTSMIGVSMEPTLSNSDQVLINRIAYIITSPKSGDVIVFLPNGNENSHLYVKRVVATPGDTVQIQNGRLYVNGVLEENNKISYDKMADAGIASNPIVLGVDEFFVLGDNRNNSEDSRSADIGLVKKQDIKGEAWFYVGDGKLGFVK